MTKALEGGEGSASRPGRSLPPGKTRYPLYRRLGGSRGRSGQVQKISPPPGFYPWTVQPMASHYTDYATRPRQTGVQILTKIFFINWPCPRRENTNIMTIMSTLALIKKFNRSLKHWPLTFYATSCLSKSFKSCGAVLYITT